MSSRKRNQPQTSPAAVPPKPPINANTDVSQTFDAQASEEAFAYRSELVFQKSQGPIPNAAEIARYAAIFPEAPAILFSEFQIEAAHRRAVEMEIVVRENRRADRGQIIGAVVFILGLLIGGGLVALGHDVAGATIVGADLVSGAAIFVGQNRRTEADPMPQADRDLPEE